MCVRSRWACLYYAPARVGTATDNSAWPFTTTLSTNRIDGLRKGCSALAHSLVQCCVVQLTELLTDLWGAPWACTLDSTWRTVRGLTWCRWPGSGSTGSWHSILAKLSQGSILDPNTSQAEAMWGPWSLSSAFRGSARPDPAHSPALHHSLGLLGQTVNTTSLRVP